MSDTTTIQPTHTLVNDLQLVWLDHATIRYYVEQMGLSPEIITMVMRVVYPIGLALELDDDEILDPLRAELSKPPLRDASSGKLIISHVMLNRILNDPPYEAELYKLFGKKVDMQTAHDLHITRAFLTRLIRDMT